VGERRIGGWEGRVGYGHGIRGNTDTDRIAGKYVTFEIKQTWGENSSSFTY